MGFCVENYKISLDTEGEMNKIQGYIDIRLSDEYLTKIGALWDTGATICYVDRELFSRLPIKETDKMTITTGNGILLVETFKADIEIAGKEIKNVLFGVNDGLKSSQFLDLIIGMNIVQHGKMIIDCTGKNKHFEFTFTD